MSRTNKILTAIVAIALIAAIGVLIYAYLPRGETQNNQQNTTPPTGPYINVTVDGLTHTYTLPQLWAMGNFTGNGEYRKNSGVFEGNGTYTGIPIKILIANLTGYSLNITAGDMSMIYNVSQVQGDVSIYNPQNATNATPIGHGGVIMVLIYAYNDQPFSGSDGNFKIGYLVPQPNSPRITAASLWLKDVRSIRIIT